MLSSSDALVLCYHALSESWPAALNVTPDAFEQQLDLLVSRGYRGVTLSEVVRGGDGGKRVAITFDDGYRSVVERGRPALEARGFVATVFVVTSAMGAEKPMSWPGIDHWPVERYGDDLMPASWEELASLAEAGWEIGSHTQTHPRLTQLPDADLAAELGGSRERCERLLGLPCDSLAYPYGDVDARVIAAAAENGYRRAATLPARLTEPTPLAWPRVGVYHGDSLRRFKLKVSPSIRRLRRSKAWSVTRLRP